MSERPELSVVIPTYNERDQIESIVNQILSACAARAVKAEVVIVDDNSPDGTGQRAEELARTRPVHVIHRASKLGLGSAVTEGIAAAAAEIVAVMDADLSHPPERRPVLYEVLN